MSAGTPIFPIEGIALDSTSEMVAGSLGDLVTDIHGHTYGVSQVFPTMAVGVPVTSGGAGFTSLGAFAEIVPINTIASIFHISRLYVEAAANDVYELVLYATTTEIGRVRFAVVGGFWGNSAYRIDCAEVAANSQVQVKTASNTGGTAITVSIQYHLRA